MPRQTKIPSPRFNLKSHQNKNEEVLIILVFRYTIPSTQEKVRVVYSSGEKVIPKYWDNKGLAKSVRNHPEYAALNDRLNELGRIAKEIFQEFQFGEIGESAFKNEIDYRTGLTKRPDSSSIGNRIPDFIEFVESFISERIRKTNSKRGTWKMLRTCANHLIEYGKDRDTLLDYKDFDFNFRNDFENWLYLKPREHSTNYAAKMMAIVRQFLHEATRRGYNQNMTFLQRGWSIKKEKTRKVVLSFEELKVLYNLDLSDNPKLDRVRDLFLIGCYSGLRFSDFTRVRPEHIIREDGVEMIQIFTKKTDTEVVIPLMPELKAIFERYDYHSPKAISNQKMNEYLKEVFKLADFNQEVLVKKSVGGQIEEKIYKKWELAQSHMARRSFATNFYQLGIPAAHLMLITGHSTEKQFFEYVNIDKRENAKAIAKQIAFLMKAK